MRLRVESLAKVLILFSCLPVALYGSSGKGDRVAPAPAFMDVRLDAPVNFSHLKRGDQLQGKVTENVFSGYRLMVPDGSRIDLTVSGMRRGPKIVNNLWPWPIRYFRPKYEKLPQFDFAEISLPDGKRVRLQVFAASALDITHVAARARARKNSGMKTRSSSHQSKRAGAAGHASGPSLELVVLTTPPVSTSTPAAMAEGRGRDEELLAGVKTLSAGSKAKLALLGPLSASKSRTGDTFKALLIQPMRLDSGEILPEGTVFEGRVAKSIPPRWLSRPGSLYLRFTRLTLPEETVLPVAASVSGVDVSRRSQVKISSEGGMSGGSPGKAHLLLDLGVGAAISKEADDGYQLIAEALVSTATDASTAGVARLVGFAFSGVYLLTRHGRGVTLPRYTTITIRFDRPPSLPSQESNGGFQREGRRQAPIRRAMAGVAGNGLADP